MCFLLPTPNHPWVSGFKHRPLVLHIVLYRSVDLCLSSALAFLCSALLPFRVILCLYCLCLDLCSVFVSRSVIFHRWTICSGAEVLIQKLHLNFSFVLFPLGMMFCRCRELPATVNTRMITLHIVLQISSVPVVFSNVLCCQDISNTCQGIILSISSRSHSILLLYIHTWSDLHSPLI